MKRTLCAILISFVLLFTGNALAVTDSETIENCKALLEMLFSPESNENYVYLDIDCNESGFIIVTASPNNATYAFSIELGLSDYASWERYVEYSVGMIESVCELLSIAGIDNPNVLYVEVSEHNVETVLYAIYNGAVIYNRIPSKHTI